MAKRKALSLAALTALLAVGIAPARAADFPQADEQMDDRLNGSLTELSRVRGRIAEEKIPLSRAVAKLQDEVLSLRRERNRRLELRDSRTIDLSSLRRQVEALEQQEDFVNSRLNEFVRDFEARLDISELPIFEQQTTAAKLAEKNANLDAGGKRELQMAVVKVALARASEQLGGHRYAGSALSPDGVLTEGTFVSLGPTVFFSSNDGVVSGLVENQLNAAAPVVVKLPDGYGPGIVALAANGGGSLPLDATLGKALKVEKARKSLFEYIDDGGAVGYVIVALAVVAVLLSAFKCYEILGLNVPGPDQVDRVLEELSAGDLGAALSSARAIDGVAGDMLTTGLQHVGEKRGVIEELLFEKILATRPLLERFLPFLAITAAAAPLLGLLGTVVGMIETFQLITVFGTGDAKSLSSGISQALVTTAEGLIVAIPTLVVHGALSRMAKRKLGLLEEISVAFVNGVSRVRHDDDLKALNVGPKELARG